MKRSSDTTTKPLDLDEQAHVRSVASRVSSLRERAIKLDRLDRDEQRELHELVRKISVTNTFFDGPPNGYGRPSARTESSTSLAHLDENELTQYEHLVGKALGNVDYFANVRMARERDAEAERARRQIEELARVAEMRSRVKHEEAGAVVLPRSVFDLMVPDSDGKVAVDPIEAGLLFMVLGQIENRLALWPGATLDGDELVWDTTRGLGIYSSRAPSGSSPIDPRRVFNALIRLSKNDLLRIVYEQPDRAFGRRGGAAAPDVGKRRPTSLWRIGRGKRLVAAEEQNTRTVFAKAREKVA